MVGKKDEKMFDCARILSVASSPSEYKVNLVKFNPSERKWNHKGRKKTEEEMVKMNSGTRVSVEPQAH